MIDWLRSSGVTILAIALIAYLVTKFGAVIVRKAVRRAISSHYFDHEEDEIRREDTLSSVIATSLKVVVWVIAGIVIISELGVNVGPLIAGAGIAGVALGFGAQSLVKDFLSGIFIVMENQYRVGDVVQLNDVSGVVVAITMRTTVLRDLDGDVHHIPNGNINLATNKTMEYSRINMNIGVGYSSDIDKLEKVVNQVSDKMAQEEDWQDEIIEPPHFERITEFADSAIIVKILGKTQPGSHWTVAGELRRRLKKAFDKEGIEIPFPQRVVHESKK